MEDTHPREVHITEPSDAPGALWREQLLFRRERLARAPGLGHRRDVAALIHEVDEALSRLEAGTYGCCSRCDGHVEHERLLADPLAQVCLACLSETETRALERDLELAAVVQGSLLPPRSMRAGDWELAHRYVPLGPVSGDYYDVIPAEAAAGAVHVVLGDVAGKGVAASMRMAGLHAIFRSLAPLGLPLEALVQRANRLFSESTLPNAYATLVVARLHPTGELELSNAGHCPPLLASRDGVRTLRANGLPLGVFPDAEYELHRFALCRDESLLLYTDGLSESENPSGEPFGQERIGRLIREATGRPPDSLLDRLLQSASAFRGTHGPADDVTLAAIRRLGATTPRPC